MELEDPQDLRAEVGKFPNSTNERKQMSTKTIKQRIAVVAVSALTAGLLSIASAPVANAASGDGVIDSTAGSVGLVGAITAGTTTRTAVLLSTGTLVISGTANDSTYKVSAGAVITATSDSGATIAADQKCVEAVAAASTVSITPTGAAGSTFTVTAYDDDTCATPGAIANVLTVTIAGTSLAGVASAAESTVRWDSDNTGSAPTAAEDATNSKTTYSNTLELYINVADAYEQDISDSGGALVVTASAGAYLGAIADDGNAVAGTDTLSTRVLTTDPSAVWVLVREATVGAGWSGTVTVSYNGIVLATKSGTITGAPASIAVSPYKIGALSTTTADPVTWLYQVKDAAGNLLSFTSTDLVLNESSNSAIVSSVQGLSSGNGVNASSSTTTYGASTGTGTITCTSTAGTADVSVKYTLSNGTVIKSNTWKATCGGDARTYTASFDKASYIQGEIATLTVAFKDIKGLPANSATAVAALDAASTAGSTNATIATPMMTLVGSLGAGTSMKPDVNGNLVYKFTVGTGSGLTAGSYNAVISFPTLAAASSVSVPYTVGTGSTEVSNADVLKSIVSLIASINKQIRALQKLILKR